MQLYQKVDLAKTEKEKVRLNKTIKLKLYMIA